MTEVDLNYNSDDERAGSGMGNSGFRGNLKSKKYFEGWYLKQVSCDGTAVYSFIPGVALNEQDAHAFIQVINGITGETHYVTYPLEQFHADTNSFNVQVGKSTFSSEGCSISIEEPGFLCKGTLKYNYLTPYPSSLLAPDIMGWYSYVPFMECFHDIVSMNHVVEGELEVNGAVISFEGGCGYIEKDRGSSFPECWIWIQCNNFTQRDTSLMLSVARIPWLGRSFAGFLGFVYHEGETIPFATWNRSKIVSVSRRAKELQILVRNRHYSLELNITENNSGELIAPTVGSMNRRIKESVDSEVHFRLFQNEILLAEDTGTHAGLEVIESIFEYLRKDGVAVSIDKDNA